MEGLSKHKFLAGVLVAFVVLAGLWLWARGPAAFANGESGAAQQHQRAQPVVLPQVQAFRKELQRADSLDGTVRLRDQLSGVKKQERALRFRVVVANRDLKLDEFFENDADAARFYGEDWQNLSSTKNENAEAMLVLAKVLEEVAAGDGGTLTPEAATQVLSIARGRLAMMREKIADSHATLTIIMKLAAMPKKPAAVAPAREEGEAFFTAHREEAQPVVTPRRAPAWSRDTARILDKYRKR
jgi:hypothetical protein